MSVALVTGATGLVGSHIVDHLIADGWTVRALVRSPVRARPALPERVELFAGDALDEASFTRAAVGCHTIFHTAANVLAAGGLEAYRLLNVEGTRNAIAAAEHANARLLHVSSVAVYGPAARYSAARRGERTHESIPLTSMSPRAYYGLSKRESEELVLRAHAQGRVWGTAVRPTVVYGRRDRHFVPRVAALVRRAAIPLLRGGRSIMSVVHAENVAQGAVLAATSNVAGGKAYNLTNDYDVSVRRFFELAGEGLGRRPLFIPMPLWLARGGLRVARAAAQLLSGGRFSFIAGSSIDFISEDNPYTSDLARQELGWAPRVRPETGVPDAFRWWAQYSKQKGAT